MLNWIGGSKPDHPMADPKQARLLLSELPANDSFKALEELAFWLDSLNRTEGFKLDRRYELLDQIDQAGKSHQRKLSQDYLAQRLQKFQENRLWTTVFEFWQRLGEGYILCVEGFQAGASGSLSIRGELAAITARAVRTLVLQLKWGSLRYGPVENRVWGDLGRIYLFAEGRGFADKNVQIYPGQHGISTVRTEFVKGLMLAASSTDGLQPIQLEVAERTVAHLAGHILLSATPRPECPHFFDLAMRQPPSRNIKGHVPTATTRYFGAGAAGPALQALAGSVIAEGVLPSDVNLGGTYDAALILDVFRHLALYWAPTPPARSSERRRTTSRITVVNGFDAVLQRIDSEGGESLDFSGDDGSESWIVENVSDGGYGAQVPAIQSDWLKVGCLLGIKAETDAAWSVGVVRRISRDEAKMRHVGIQVLARIAIPAKITAAGNATSFNATREAQGAILLSTAPDKNGEIGLMLRADSYSGTQMMEMRVRGKVYLVKPARLVENSRDYDTGRFKVTAHTS